MNYFAHGRRFTSDPFFLAGTAVPDWLGVVDRQVRVRSRHADAWSACDDPCVAAVARGVRQHLADDAWFHETLAFAECSMAIGRMVRDVLPTDDGFRPHFLGHILVEILLDAELIAEDPAALAAYYRAMNSLDAAAVESAVNRIAPRGTSNLATFIGLFSRERFLYDYQDDGKLLFRLNQVMRRVRLPTLPPQMSEVFPEARRLVSARGHELLTAPAECDQPEPKSEFIAAQTAFHPFTETQP